jgi:Tol biopolymer transport system component/tRNA A-37 threonylcarbamoyl transferase component Bud32
VPDQLVSLRAALAGRYTIERELGRGGMATVYQAEDLKHQRKVAVKVLRPELSALLGGERFLAEIRVTAALQHPHLLPLFDSGTTGELLYYVMPLVDGESLRRKLEREKQLSVGESIRIATQVASALDHAHRHGIIHRDIKPENILLHEGQALVADFGIALALESAGADRLTGTGISLGTPQYMSPEQVAGEERLDARTDVYSLACVVYEMLAGQPPHTGPTVQAVLTKVVTEEPRPITDLRSRVPRHIAAALDQGLAKLPADRFASVREFAETLAGRLEIRPFGKVAVVFPRWTAWVAVAVLAGLAATAVVTWAIRGTGEGASNITRYAVPVPTGYSMLYGQEPDLAISPDGRKLVYRTAGRLFMRALDRFDAQPIPGSEEAHTPFFSPDGVWLGFVRGPSLMKVPVAGGTPIKIADAFVGGGAAWGRDGRVIYAGALGNDGLWSVPAAGGTPQQITIVSDSAGETNHMWPDLLPDGAVLYTALGPSGHAQDARLVVHDGAQGTRTVVVQGMTCGRYVAPGYLLYADATGTLLMQPFDLPGRRITGPARAVLAGVRISGWGGGAPYALSETGTLVYITGTELEKNLLVELDLRGKERRRFGPPRALGFLALSPDGRTLAMSTQTANNADIWLMDIATARFDRFTFDITEDESPVWSPDGRRIAYSSAWVGQQRHVFVKTLASAEPARLVYTGKRHLHVTSWSPDGRWLALQEYSPRSTDIWLLDFDDPTRLVPVATTPAAEEHAVFSPDGHWLAYSSDESGRQEVYVVSVPGLRADQQVSREGGVLPRWSATGKELFFFDRYFGERGHVMMARRARASGGWQQAAPLFEIARGEDFVVAQDGRSMYVVVPNPTAAAREIFVVVNWLEEVVPRGLLRSP